MTIQSSTPLGLQDESPSQETFLQEVLAGLGRPRKILPCKYLYDERGSALFDAICDLPEYFPTRTETAIIEAHGLEMVKMIGAGSALIEYGSGSSTKTRILLDHLNEPVAYVPIDISREHLIASCEALQDVYPDLLILPVCADYTGEFDLPELPESTRRRIVFFPGSTIGNFHPDQAIEFLRRIGHQTGQGGGLLIGAALKCNRQKLIKAYDDAAGITAAFNLNILEHINRELDADFNLDQFEHRAEWNEELGRIEMHLVSRGRQNVSIGGRSFRFEEGETIRTECSYKYDLDEFRAMAREAGFWSDTVWCDPDHLFSVHFLSVA